MIARIEGWKERRGMARGRAETDRVRGEAHKLFDEGYSSQPTRKILTASDICRRPPASPCSRHVRRH